MDEGAEGVHVHTSWSVAPSMERAGRIEQTRVVRKPASLSVSAAVAAMGSERE